MVENYPDGWEDEDYVAWCADKSTDDLPYHLKKYKRVLAPLTYTNKDYTSGRTNSTPSYVLNVIDVFCAQYLLYHKSTPASPNIQITPFQTDPYTTVYTAGVFCYVWIAEDESKYNVVGVGYTVIIDSQEIKTIITNPNYSVMNLLSAKIDDAVMKIHKILHELETESTITLNGVKKKVFAYKYTGSGPVEYIPQKPKETTFSFNKFWKGWK